MTQLIHKPANDRSYALTVMISKECKSICELYDFSNVLPFTRFVELVYGCGWDAQGAIGPYWRLNLTCDNNGMVIFWLNASIGLFGPSDGPYLTGFISPLLKKLEFKMEK